MSTREARGARARIRAAVTGDAEAVWRVHTTSVRELCAGWYTDEEIAVWLQRDPIDLLRAHLLGAGVAAADLERIGGEVDEEIEASLEFAKASPYPDPDLPARVVFATPVGGGDA